MTELRRELVHAVTRYDRKQANKKSYNPNALGIYLGRVDDIMADVEAGADPKAAITAGMTGPLLKFVLKFCDLGEPDENEGRSRYTYSPVAR